MKVQRRLMQQPRFIETHQVFPKRKRSDTFLIEWHLVQINFFRYWRFFFILVSSNSGDLTEKDKGEIK